jgi:hypothetical protein
MAVRGERQKRPQPLVADQVNAKYVGCLCRDGRQVMRNIVDKKDGPSGACGERLHRGSLGTGIDHQRQRQSQRIEIAQSRSGLRRRHVGEDDDIKQWLKFGDRLPRAFDRCQRIKCVPKDIEKLRHVAVRKRRAVAAPADIAEKRIAGELEVAVMGREKLVEAIDEQENHLVGVDDQQRAISGERHRGRVT